MEIVVTLASSSNMKGKRVVQTVARGHTGAGVFVSLRQVRLTMLIYEKELVERGRC